MRPGQTPVPQKHVITRLLPTPDLKRGSRKVWWLGWIGPAVPCSGEAQVVPTVHARSPEEGKMGGGDQKLCLHPQLAAPFGLQVKLFVE
ncbi:UNVERIFIED_CONTAM: hypothetical protein K2H54_047208 [Gekko kuhli]